MAFTHLHLHTEYSLLDGATRINKLVEKVKEFGMDSVAITDHGVMFGVIDFYKACKENNIKPIIGCEIYTTQGDRHSKDPVKDRMRNHLVLLSKDLNGYKNLMKIVSAAHLEGFYHKPRADKELLKKYSDGLICLSACMQGIVPRLLLAGDYQGAKREAVWYRDTFGAENYFLEIQNQGIEEEKKLIPMMQRLSEEIGVGLVATNDVHYVEEKDAEAHDILLCIQTGALVSDEHRMRYANNQFYFKSEEEMRKIFSDIPEAVDNAAKIAERCNVEFDFSQMHIPFYTAPDGKTNNDYLRELCQEGLKKRYGAEASLHEERLEYELSTIEQMGYVEYFLIVWDFIDFAKKRGIAVGPGRGSAAGSIVAYTLEITDTDPIKHGLIFERFLNPERISMPDIDIDFADNRRQEVIDYVIEKYGKEKVVQIVAFGSMRARNAVRDVGRVLDVSYSETDKIAKAIPQELNITIDKALKMNPELMKSYEEQPVTKKVLDMARALEGMPRHTTVHAAGVVISKEDIGEYVPLFNSDKGICTQFEKNTIEKLGLLKMDFLGLRNLTVIDDAVKLIEKQTGEKIDLSNLDLEDEKIYKMISSGNTPGVFQLESGGMTGFMKRLKPDCFADIVAGISLFRPGPMQYIDVYIRNKKNPKKTKYLHPLLEPVLAPTHGVIVYQEQVMEIVRSLAGYSYGRSDLMRRAMAKKNMEAMIKEKEFFVNGSLDENGNIIIPGAVRNGVPKDVAEEIFNQMVSFAEYAFNKSHAAAYAIIGYQTAYLKCYYPAQYMTALLSSVMGDASQTAKYIKNCRDMHIEVCPPDVNEGEINFSYKDGKIHYGLKGIKNLGEGAINAIIESRKTNGIPTDLQTFIKNLDTSRVNRKSIESLIKAGATSSLDGNMAQHMAVYESLLESSQSDSKKNLAGQVSLFQTASEIMEEATVGVKLPDIEDFDEKSKMNMEKEMLGVYIKKHPLSEYDEVIESLHITNTEELRQSAEEVGTGKIKDGEIISVAGIVTGIKNITTKRQELMAIITVEDVFGSIECVVFPGVYRASSDIIREDSIIFLRGKVDFSEDKPPSLAVSEVDSLNNKLSTISSKTEYLKLNISSEILTERIFYDIMEILVRYPGNTQVLVYTPGKKPFRADDGMNVNVTQDLIEDAEKLLGHGNVKYGGKI